MATSTPTWPRYIAEPKVRQLAYQDDDGRWICESGEIVVPGSWPEAMDALFELNLQVFVGNVDVLLQRWPEVQENGKVGGKERGWWVELGIDPQERKLLCVNVHRPWRNKAGRMSWQVRKLVSSKPWGMPCVAALVKAARWLYDALGTGVEATPGGVGAATMHELWRTHQHDKWPKHHRPTWPCILDFQAHMVGSRKEALHPLEVFSAAYELDRTNGFAAEVDILPSGTTGTLANAHKYLMPLEDPPAKAVKHWWGRCYVRLWRDLPPGDLAPFGIWSDARQEWDWPTREGGYWCYLWKQEAEAIQERYREDGSMEVLAIDYAWTWETETAQLAEWAERMDQVRRAIEYGRLEESTGDRPGVLDAGATRDQRKALAGLVKLAIVAGIGRLGMEYARYAVVPDGQQQPGDEQVTSDLIPDMQLWLHKEAEDLGTPKHWHAYVIAMQNLNLYRESRKQYLAGKLQVARNVDGIMLAEAPAGGVAPEVAARGEYKVRYRGDYLAAPAPGIIITPDKIATPGLSGVERRRLMRTARAGPLEGHAALREQFRHSMTIANDVKLQELERLRAYYVKTEHEQKEQESG